MRRIPRHVVKVNHWHASFDGDASDHGLNLIVGERKSFIEHDDLFRSCSASGPIDFDAKCACSLLATPWSISYLQAASMMRIIALSTSFATG